MDYLLKKEEIYRRADEGDLSVLNYTNLFRKKGLISQEQKNYLDLLALKNKFLKLENLFEIYRRSFSPPLIACTYKFMNDLYKKIENIVIQICYDEGMDFEDTREKSLKDAEDDNSSGLINCIAEVINLNKRRLDLIDMAEDFNICLKARYSFMTINKEGKIEKKTTEENVFLN